MSGHSKWSTIKRKKGAADAKRGQAFTKYANAIAAAAREGADPQTNNKLRLAVEKAKLINMPVTNIKRAIERGGGQSKEAQLAEIMYEGYGPGGVAVMVSCATDNTNRTLAEVRNVLTKGGGNLAAPGAVAYQFSQKGLIIINSDTPEEVSLAAIDSGAEDIEIDGPNITIYTPAKELMAIKDKLEAAGYQIESAELSYEPIQTTPIHDKETAAKILKLADNLEELDDVLAVYSNFDIPEDVLKEAAL